MIYEVAFTVPRVQPWQRTGYHRASGRHYTKAETKAMESEVARAYRACSVARYGAVVRAGPHVPVQVRVDTFRPLPDGRPKRVEREPDTFKSGGGGDVDNMAKAVLDGLNGVAWDDDAQVTRLYAEKHDRTRGARERTCVTVRWEEQ